MIRLLLLVLGLAALVGIVWHVGLPRILEALGSLEPLALLFILTPSLVMYLLEAYGWRLTLGDHQRTVSFGRLLAIRTAGEVVNMTTPSAYVGGEPLKAYLLLRYRVPLVDGLASVIIAKTIMTIAQVLFILLGIALAFWILGESASSKQLGLAAIVSIGLLVFGTAAFLVVQSRGLFVGLLGVLRALRIRIGFLERREATLRELDQSILQFYSRSRNAFLLSLGVFFLAWLVEAIEVYVILLALGVPADLLTSISIGALSAFIKGGTFFIPGSVGAQEGGNLALLLAFGYSDVTGVTFALLRRVREVVWIGIGLVCLASMGGRVRTDHVPEQHQGSQPNPSRPG